MRRNGVPAVLLFLAGLACAHGPGARKQRASLPWTEVRTAHFTVLSDGSVEHARAAAFELERVRAALIAGSWSPRTPNVLSGIRAIVLADRDEFASYFPEIVDGFAPHDSFGEQVLVLHGGLGESSVLKHELAHALDGSFLLRQPRWLSEGMSLYLETVRVARGGGGMLLGEPNFERGLHLLGGSSKLDFARVMSAGSEIFSQRYEVVADFYAQSWLLVHTLINQHREQFSGFLHRLARAEEPKAAFAAAFPGLTLWQLETEASALLRSGSHFSVARVPLPEIEDDAAVRALTPGEALAHQAELLKYAANFKRNSPDAIAEAHEMALRALAVEPGNLVAAAIELETAAVEGRPARARAMVERNPGDARAWRIAAVSLPRPERLPAAEKAAQLAPGDPRALNLLAWNLALRGRGAEALPSAIRAAKLKPADAAILDTLALTLDEAGRCAEAVKAQERALETLAEDARTADEMRRRLERIEARCKGAGDPAYTDDAHRLACDEPAPRGAPGEPETKAHVTYDVAPDGTASGATAEGPAAAAVSDWVQGCRYQPAWKQGAPVAAHVSEDVTVRAGPAAAK